MMPEITEMTPDDYRFLYGKLHKDQIPDDIYEKIMCGEEFSPDEEKRIKAIIKSSEDARKMSEDRYLKQRQDTIKNVGKYAFDHGYHEDIK